MAPSIEVEDACRCGGRRVKEKKPVEVGGKFVNLGPRLGTKARLGISLP